MPNEEKKPQNQQHNGWVKEGVPDRARLKRIEHLEFIVKVTLDPKQASHKYAI
jgi:hypothetical protein